MSKTFYMIRHKTNGTWLPNAHGRGGRGGTHQEPTINRPPRLFTKRQHANATLRWWLTGICAVRYGGLTGWDEREPDEEWYTKEPPSPRVKEEWEVAKIQVVMLVNTNATHIISS